MDDGTNKYGAPTDTTGSGENDHRLMEGLISATGGGPPPGYGVHPKEAKLWDEPVYRIHPISRREEAVGGLFHRFSREHVRILLLMKAEGWPHVEIIKTAKELKKRQDDEDKKNNEIVQTHKEATHGQEVVAIRNMYGNPPMPGLDGDDDDDDDEDDDDEWDDEWQWDDDDDDDDGSYYNDVDDVDVENTTSGGGFNPSGSFSGNRDGESFAASLGAQPKHQSLGRQPQPTRSPTGISKTMPADEKYQQLIRKMQGQDPGLKGRRQSHSIPGRITDAKAIDLSAINAPLVKSKQSKGVKHMAKGKKRTIQLIPVDIEHEEDVEKADVAGEIILTPNQQKKARDMSFTRKQAGVANAASTPVTDGVDKNNGII